MIGSFLRGRKIAVLAGRPSGSALIHYLVRHVSVDPHDIRVFYLDGSPTAGIGDVEGSTCARRRLNQKDVIKACAGTDYIFT